MSGNFSSNGVHNTTKYFFHQKVVKKDGKNKLPFCGHKKKKDEAGEGVRDKHRGSLIFEQKGFSAQRN